MHNFTLSINSSALNLNWILMVLSHRVGTKCFFFFVAIFRIILIQLMRTVWVGEKEPVCVWRGGVQQQRGQRVKVNQRVCSGDQSQWKSSARHWRRTKTETNIQTSTTWVDRTLWWTAYWIWVCGLNFNFPLHVQAGYNLHFVIWSSL